MFHLMYAQLASQANLFVYLQLLGLLRPVQQVMRSCDSCLHTGMPLP